MIDFESLRKRRTPNWYLVAPEGLCSEVTAHTTSPVYDVSVAELQKAWESIIAQQPRILHKNSDEQNRKYEIVQRTAFFRFPDTITVQFISKGEQSTLAIYSRSKYGRKDFGKNKSRIDGWLKLLDEKVG